VLDELQRGACAPASTAVDFAHRGAVRFAQHSADQCGGAISRLVRQVSQQLCAEQVAWPAAI
jgi:hypothetical protein